MVYGRGGGFLFCGLFTHRPRTILAKNKAHNIIVSKTNHKMIQQEIIDATGDFVMAGILEKILYSPTRKWQQTTIAKQLCIGVTTVWRKLAQLRDMGFIDYKKSTYNGTTTTDFFLLEKSNELLGKLQAGGSGQPYTQTIPSPPTCPLEGSQVETRQDANGLSLTERRAQINKQIKY